MSDAANVGAYASSMSQSLFERGKAVGRMIEAGQRNVDDAKQKVTDQALSQLQQATATKNELLEIGAKINIYA